MASVATGLAVTPMSFASWQSHPRDLALLQSVRFQCLQRQALDEPACANRGVDSDVSEQGEGGRKKIPLAIPRIPPSALVASAIATITNSKPRLM
jgi:hypothetical protein